MHAAVSPNPDDDNGGAIRGSTAGAGHGHWLGASATAWDQCCGRPHRESIADALHNTGALPGVRPAPAANPGRETRCISPRGEIYSGRCLTMATVVASAGRT